MQINAMRSVAVTALCLLLAACGGSTTSADVTPFDIQPGPPPAGGGSGGGGTTPPPTPPQAPVWLPDAYAHSRVLTFGSFPSDITRYGTTVFVTDADEIDAGGAQIVPMDISGSTPAHASSFMTTPILAAHLVDSQGAPVAVPATIGFGLYCNDLHIVHPGLGFVLVNAGGSDSTPTLSNVLAFDPQTGTVNQTISLTHTYTSSTSLFDSQGTPVPGNAFVQAGAEGMAYVDVTPTSGLLYVAMTNLIFGAPSFGSDRYPGTVQVYHVDLRNSAAPVTPISGTAHATRTLVTNSFNPVSVDLIRTQGTAGGAPTTRVLVTCGGTTGFDPSFRLVPTTSASVEAFDGGSSAFLGSFTIGLVGLVGSPALGFDGAGHHVGFFPSGVTGEIYLLRLDGLYSNIVNPATLAVLRGQGNGIPIAGPAGSPGGNITGVAISPDGATLIVAGFGDLFATPRQPGRVYLLGLPTDVVTGSGFGASFVPGATEFASVVGRTVGGLVVLPNAGSRPDVFVNVGGALDGNGIGTGPASLGTLQTHGLIK